MDTIRWWGAVVLLLLLGCQPEINAQALEPVVGAWSRADPTSEKVTLWITPSGEVRILGIAEQETRPFVRSARGNRFSIHEGPDDDRDPMVLVVTSGDAARLINSPLDNELGRSPAEAELVRISDQELDEVLRGWNARKTAMERLRP